MLQYVEDQGLDALAVQDFMSLVNAMDAGDVNICSNAPVLSKDQRGESRPSGSQCDLGSFEVQQVAAVHELSINDVTLAEGNAGTTNFNFTVTLSHASDQEVRVVRFNPRNTGNASPLGDYQVIIPEVIIFAPGETAKTVTIVVNGDTSMTVLGIRDGEVVLAVDGPEWTEIRERELLEEARSASILPR